MCNQKETEIRKIYAELSKDELMNLLIATAKHHNLDFPKPTSTFKITICDSYCTWGYDFELPKTTSINDVLNAIVNKFGVVPTTENLIKHNK
jgi:hypothetical protein